MTASKTRLKADVIIVMGVSGAGKTTVGQLLAKKLDWQFKDADDFHTPKNKAKMHGGTPLTDADRMPWLETLAKNIQHWSSAQERTVLACSALKRSYRAILAGSSERVAVIYLRADFGEISKRLEGRKDHFMNKDLLASQFAALEEPHDQKGENGGGKELSAGEKSCESDNTEIVTVSALKTPDQIVEEVLAALYL